MNKNKLTPLPTDRKVKKSTKAWYKVAGQTIWESRPIKWLAQGITIICVAYTAVNTLTTLTTIQQLQGAAALLIVAVVINRAFKK